MNIPLADSFVMELWTECRVVVGLGCWNTLGKKIHVGHSPWWQAESIWHQPDIVPQRRWQIDVNLSMPAVWANRVMFHYFFVIGDFYVAEILYMGLESLCNFEWSLFLGPHAYMHYDLVDKIRFPLGYFIIGTCNLPSSNWGDPKGSCL